MALPANFMERLAATEDDASAFSELVWGTPLHDGQKRYDENAHADVNFLLPGNSWGKTEFIKRKSLHDAWFKKRRRGQVYDSFEDWLKAKWGGLIGSYNYNIAKESFDRLEEDRKNLETVRALVQNVVRTDPVEVQLSNGSKLHWGSLDGRGRLVEAKRLQRIYVDEVGHIPDLAYTFDNVLFPRTMGVMGIVNLFGTPKEYSDPYLLEVYEKGKDGKDPFYYSQAGSVLENQFWPLEERDRVFANPRYVTGWTQEHAPGEYCENLACRNGEHPILTPVGRQVINGEFVLSGGFFFNRLHVARVFRWEAEAWGEPEWHGDNHFHFEPDGKRLYHGAFDLGGNKRKLKKSKGSDPTVGFVVDYTERPWRIVRYDFIEGGEADWEDKYDLMHEVYTDYHLPYLIIDATGQVDSVQEALQRRGIEVEGIQFGGTSSRKYNMLRNLQLVTEMEWSEGQRGLLRSPAIPGLKWELDHYLYPDDEHIRQDRVMALGMVCDHIAQCELPPPSFGEWF